MASDHKGLPCGPVGQRKTNHLGSECVAVQRVAPSADRGRAHCAAFPFPQFWNEQTHGGPILHWLGNEKDLGLLEFLVSGAAVQAWPGAKTLRRDRFTRNRGKDLCTEPGTASLRK